MSSATIWILVSDSSTALTTGRGKSLFVCPLPGEKASIRLRVHPRNLLGQEFARLIVKRAIEIVKDCKDRCGEDVRMNLYISWFGNELVGKKNIAPMPTWPYDDGDGVARPDGGFPQAHCLVSQAMFGLQCAISRFHNRASRNPPNL